MYRSTHNYFTVPCSSALYQLCVCVTREPFFHIDPHLLLIVKSNAIFLQCDT